MIGIKMDCIYKNILKREFVLVSILIVVAGILSLWLDKALLIAFVSTVLLFGTLLRYWYRMSFLKNYSPDKYAKNLTQEINSEYEKTQAQITIAEEQSLRKFRQAVSEFWKQFLISSIALAIVAMIGYLAYEVVLKRLTLSFLSPTFVYSVGYIFIIIVLISFLEAIYNYLVVPFYKELPELKEYAATLKSTDLIKDAPIPQRPYRRYPELVFNYLKATEEPRIVHLEGDLYYQAYLHLTGDIVYLKKTGESFQPVYQSTNISNDREEDIAKAKEALVKQETR
jgi:hypothetical protein